MAVLSGIPIAVDLTATTTEQYIDVPAITSGIVHPVDGDVLVSFNDSTHYKKYYTGMAIPFSNTAGVNRVYYKSVSGSVNLGFWGNK